MWLHGGALAVPEESAVTIAATIDVPAVPAERVSRVGRWAWSRAWAACTTGLAIAVLSAPGFAQGQSVTRAPAGADTPDARPGVSAVYLDDGGGSTELADAVEAAAGVDARQTGGPGRPATLSVRGHHGGQTRVLIDGVPVDGATDPGGFDLSLLPPELFDRAIVYRGATPVRFGRPLPGGAIDLQPRFEPAPSVRVQATAGSFGTTRGHVAWQHATPRTERLLSAAALRTDGTLRFFDDGGTPLQSDDDAPDRVLRNADVDRVAGLWRQRWRPGSWRITALGLGVAMWRGEPGIGTVQARRASTGSLRGHVAIDARRPRALGPRADVSVLASASMHDARARDPRAELSLVPLDAHEREVTGLLRGTIVGRLDPRLRIDGVVDATVERYAALDADANIDGATRVGPGFGVEVRGEPVAGRLELLAGARVDGEAHAVQGGDAPDPRLHVAPQLGASGLLVDANRVRLQLAASAHAASRSPSFVELYATRGAFVGDPDLRAEFRVGGDVALAVDLHAADPDLPAMARIELTGFDQRVDDVIVLVDNGSGVARPINLSTARLRGAEFAVQTSPGQVLTVELAATALDARDATGGDTDGNRLPFRPAWAGDGSVATRWDAGPGAIALTVAGHARSRFARDAANVLEAPARFTADAGVRYTLDTPTSAAFDLTIRNLADARTGEVDVRDGGATVGVDAPHVDVAARPLPGRSVWGTITLTRPLRR